MILGYIVTNKKLNGISGFVEQVDSITKADSTKPILVIGWKEAKKYDGYKNILDKQLSFNVYWTFSKTESRSDFEQDLKKFYNIIYNNILNNINYYYINFFKLKYNKIKKLINILYSRERKNIYISNNFVYVQYRPNNILGISLSMLEYCGIGKSKVMNKIRSNPYNILLEDDNQKVFRLSKELGDKKYSLPYFMD